ncbi:MAG: hypothetical protein ACTSYU_14140 [Promethearchaeota archaeon]
MKLRKLVKFSSILLITIAVISVQLAPISGENSDKLSLSLSKNMGTAFQDKIEGDFTIRGSGDEDIMSLELYFNETQVANSTSNELTLRFNTNDYWIGDVNMTLKGFNENGDVFQYSIYRVFLDPTIGNYILIGVGILVVVSVGFSLYKYTKDKKATKKTREEIKKGIRIDIDKNFK